MEDEKKFIRILKNTPTKELKDARFFIDRELRKRGE